MLICIEKNYHYRHHHHNTPGQHTWIVLPLGSQSKLSYPIIFQNSQAFSAFSIRSATGKERVSWVRQDDSMPGSTARQHLPSKAGSKTEQRATKWESSHKYLGKTNSAAQPEWGKWTKLWNDYRFIYQVKSLQITDMIQFKPGSNKGNWF